MIEWTAVQKQRLLELGATPEDLSLSFSDQKERNRVYQVIEHKLVTTGREQLFAYQRDKKRPALAVMESRIIEALTSAGFCQVATPILLSAGLLAKMTIDKEHPLYEQVFWVDSRKCLRPMLAPNLYFVLKDLLRIWPHPVRIFEIGPCFRKDSQGGNHMQEFTMLNLVEMGLAEENCKERLQELATLVMNAAEIEDFKLEIESSDVYGETIDVVSGDLELGSGAMGPHALDQAWGIDLPWVGIGFGLERLAMTKGGYNSVQKVGRSLTYLDGIRLNI